MPQKPAHNLNDAWQTVLEKLGRETWDTAGLSLADVRAHARKAYKLGLSRRPVLRLHRAACLADAGGAQLLAYHARCALFNTARERHWPHRQAICEFPFILAFLRSSHLARKLTWADDFSDCLFLLRYYPFCIEWLLCYPEIPAGIISELVDDLDSWHDALRIPSRRPLALRRTIALETGNQALAERLSQRWEATPRSQDEDCRNCEQEQLIRLALETDRQDEAIDLGLRLLRYKAVGRLECSSWKPLVAANLLLPLCARGQHEDALPLYRLCRELTKRTDMLVQHGLLLRFLAVTENLGFAAQLMHQGIARAFNSEDASGRAFFLNASVFALGILATSSRFKIRLALPDAAPLRKSGNTYAAEEVQRWLASETMNLAKRFDQRNGNNSFSRRLSRYDFLADQIHPLTWKD